MLMYFAIGLDRRAKHITVENGKNEWLNETLVVLPTQTFRFSVNFRVKPFA